MATAVLSGGCAGAGGQGFSSMMPQANGALGGGSSSASNASGGSTLVKVHVPWVVSASPTPSPGRGMFATPTPLPTPTAQSTVGLSTSLYPIQALAINVSGPTSLNQTIALTPGSPGCAPASTGSVCQVSLSLAPGIYTATVSAFSNSNASQLSAVGVPATIAFSVVPTTSNVVNLAIGSVPASLDVVPATALSVENSQGGIDLYGAGKHQVVVEMLDAAQNAIVGTGAMSYSMTPGGGQLALTVAAATPAPTGPSASNVFTIGASQANANAMAALRLSATFNGSGSNPCLQPGAACSGSVNVDVKQLLAVANSSANNVTLYAGNPNAPVATVSNGVVNPQALVFDALGDLFVASQPGSVIEYAPPYTGLPTTIAVGVNHPQALALDNRGDLFVANGSGSNTVTEYAAPYTGAPVATVSSGVEDPVSLALDAAGDLFVVNQSSNTVTEYAAPYNQAPTTISNGLNGPNSLAVDGHGNLFVSNLNSTPNSVVEYSPPYSSSSAPTAWITSGVNEQGAIGVGGSDLFVPNQGANSVTEYTPPFNGSAIAIKGGQSQPVAIAVDVVGNLFVANYGNNSVTEYAPPYAGVSWTTISNGISSPQALALSPATGF